MFWIVLFFLCFWRLDGTFGYEEKLVTEGDSVTLNSGLTEMKNDYRIQWSFGNKNIVIAEINKRTDRFTVCDDVLDGRFRDRLKLDNQTGSLTITNITTEHAGRYELQINNVRKSFDIIIYGEKNVSVKIGDSVTLNTGLTEIMDNDRIDWIKWKKDDVNTNYGDVNDVLAHIIKHYNIITVFDDALDGRFRDRLKLNKQTGSLTITNITAEHTGVYQLKINNARVDFLLTAYDEISVMEGDSVTLNSHFIEMMDDDEFWRIRSKVLTDNQIEWRFFKTLIAKINRRVNTSTVYDDVLDGRFRDRLNLDNQTLSLTITNTTTEDAGDYKLKITGTKPSSITFEVSVYSK
uniref:Immunoglobulin domain-containing protein n=1 Tax=Cyprinus carpio TaxID=7962 RepID=A0A8C1LCM7_CYPCA